MAEVSLARQLQVKSKERVVVEEEEQSTPISQESPPRSSQALLVL